jgi:hypothetical protein
MMHSCLIMYRKRKGGCILVFFRLFNFFYIPCIKNKELFYLGQIELVIISFDKKEKRNTTSFSSF